MLIGFSQIFVIILAKANLFIIFYPLAKANGNEWKV
jgi:hypothetical protein